MLAAPSALVSLFEPWANIYNDSHLAQTAVTFAHVGALLVGGGIAIATDRATLGLEGDVDRRRHLLEVARVHRVVVVALAVVLASGVALFATDVDSFWSSPVYWVKMALVAALLANGLRIRGLERAASAAAVIPTTHWSALRRAAAASLVLWLATTLAGVALINYA